MTHRDLPGKISVLMPAFNEEGVIHYSIQETARALDGCDYEIIVVDDGSSDGTYGQARNSLASNGRVKVVRYEDNQGKGWALRCGFEQAEGELVVFLDADLDLPPGQIWTLWEVMKETGADVVIGSKRHPDSRLDYPWQRRVVSAVYFSLVKWLFGLSLRDTQTGLKLFRRQVLQQTFPRMNIRRFAFDLELLVAASRFGYRIAEAPVTIHFQRGKLGRIGPGAILRMIRDTLAVFYRASFWKWLSPGIVTRMWMVAFAVGLVAASLGVGGLLTRMSVSESLSRVVWCLTLQFVDKAWRDWLLIAGGGAMVIISLLELNKHVLKAFAQPDQGDLAGITNRTPTSNANERTTVEQGLGNTLGDHPSSEKKVSTSGRPCSVWKL